MASETDDELARLWVHWCGLLREHNDPSDIQGNFRSGLLRLAYSYARMSVLSFGFQYAFGKTSVGQDVTLLRRVSREAYFFFFSRREAQRPRFTFLSVQCLRAAFDVLNAVLEDVAVPDKSEYDFFALEGCRMLRLWVENRSCVTDLKRKACS